MPRSRLVVYGQVQTTVAVACGFAVNAASVNVASICCAMKCGLKHRESQKYQKQKKLLKLKNLILRLNFNFKTLLKLEKPL